MGAEVFVIRRMQRAWVVVAVLASGGALLMPVSPSAAKSMVNGSNNPAARAAAGKALAKGDVDALRIAWTVWTTRDVSQTVEIKKGRLSRYGGMVKNARSERALTDEEKRQLLSALREAKVDRLVWIDRDVKGENDRVLNVDVLKADGGVDPVGAFVRTNSTWRSGATEALANLLDKWLSGEAK